MPNLHNWTLFHNSVICRGARNNSDVTSLEESVLYFISVWRAPFSLRRQLLISPPSSYHTFKWMNITGFSKDCTTNTKKIPYSGSSSTIVQSAKTYGLQDLWTSLHLIYFSVAQWSIGLTHAHNGGSWNQYWSWNAAQNVCKHGQKRVCWYSWAQSIQF